jgi:ABC-type uncharacterized transport system substrate-binding protein
VARAAVQFALPPGGTGTTNGHFRIPLPVQGAEDVIWKIYHIARPNRNITGLVYRAPELAAKQLELLVEAFPGNKPIAALWEPASAEQFTAAQHTAQSLHIDLRSHKLENPPFDFDEAFRRIAQDGPRMVLVLSGPTFGMQRAHIADLALQHHLPTMFTFKYYVTAGGLMSYGIDTIPIFRRAASFVAKIPEERSRPIFRSSNQPISNSH